MLSFYDIHFGCHIFSLDGVRHVSVENSINTYLGKCEHTGMCSEKTAIFTLSNTFLFLCRYCIFWCANKVYILYLCLGRVQKTESMVMIKADLPYYASEKRFANQS